MYQKDLVSVIIPTYNGSKYLLSTVSSALSQTYSPIEIIVVDDGSTEDIEAVLRPVMGKIRYFRQENRGPAVARNHGLMMSKGSYIAFLDHDDLWMPEKTALQVGLIKENPNCGLVYSSRRLIDGNGQLIPIAKPKNPPSGNVLLQFAMRNRIPTFSATLLRREVFDKIGYLNESMEILTCDDYEMWLRVAEKYEVLYAKDSPLFYRMHENNLVKRYFQAYSATITVLERFLDHISNKVTPKHFRELKKAITSQIYNKTREYAYTIYYEDNDRLRAGLLFKKAYKSKPWMLRDLAFYVICRLPENTVNNLKIIKRRMSGISAH